MKSKIMLTLILLTTQIYGQDTISSSIVGQFTSNFSIDNYQLDGQGADLLKSEFMNSQFVLIGETHDNAEISIFTSAIIPILKQNGFNYIFTENGNNGLQIMIENAQKSSTIQEGLAQFYTYEYQRLNAIPIPFFYGIEDAKMLESIMDNRITAFGIDQEYFYSFPLLFDQLLSLSSKSPEIIQAHKTALNFVLQEYEIDRRSEEYPISSRLNFSIEIDEFLALLDTNDQKSTSIINAIKSSTEIYEYNSIDKQTSFIARAEFMQNEFNKHYHFIQNEADVEAKILIKMGALHTQRGKTSLGVYDIGETVSNLATANGTQDLNLFFMFRYFIDQEEELGYFDNSEGNSKWLKERKPFMEQGQVDQWSIINLKMLRAYLKANSIYCFEPLSAILNQHDYVIIPPASKDATPNYMKF